MVGNSHRIFCEGENIMEKERLNKILDELEFFLNYSPIEDDCTDKENKMYSDMVNLKNSIESVLDKS